MICIHTDCDRRALCSHGKKHTEQEYEKLGMGGLPFTDKWGCPACGYCSEEEELACTLSCTCIPETNNQQIEAFDKHVEGVSINA